MFVLMHYKERTKLVMPDKKMFCINEDGVSEGVVAKSKEQGFEFYRELVGEKCVEEDYQYYLRDVPGSSFEDFIDYLVREEEMDREFTLHNDDGTKERKTIREFLEGESECPVGGPDRGASKSRPGRRGRWTFTLTGTG